LFSVSELDECARLRGECADEADAWQARAVRRKDWIWLVGWLVWSAVLIFLALVTWR
jgi:hypothetical protein